MFFLGMLFLYFPFYYAKYTSHPTLVIVSTVVFACVYCLSFFSRHPLYLRCSWFYMIAYIAGMSFLGSIQFSLFLFNLSNMLAWHYVEDTWTYRTLSYALLLGAVLVYGLVGPFDFEMRAFIIVIHLFGLGLLLGSRIQARKERMEKQLQEQYQSINLLLAENERNRIGRDLHDTLGHVFAMLSVKADLVQTLLDYDQIEKAKKEVGELQDVAKGAMQEVRQIVQSIKQATVAEEMQIIQQMLALAEVDCEVCGLEKAASLSLSAQSHLSMVLRELANNLLKHSQAKSCRFLFEEDGREVRLIYEDDGRGFISLKGDELHTIKDRLIRIKGRVEFLSLAQPTHLAIQIPKKESEE